MLYLDTCSTRATEAPTFEGLAPTFFAKAAEIIATPWMLAAGADFLYPQTMGERPPDLAEGGRYFAAVDALTRDDAEVHQLLTEVFHLAKPLSVLYEEPLRSRVIARQEKRSF